MKHCSTSLLSRASVLGAAASLLSLAACDSGSQERDALDGLPPTGQLKLQLTRADNCDELLVRIQDGLVVPLAERAKQLRNPQTAYPYGPGGYPVMGGVGVAVDSVAAPPVPTSGGAQMDGAEDAAPRPAPAPSGMAPTSGPAATQPSAPEEGESVDLAPNGTSSNPGAPGDGDFSGTTVQIQDVDEADIVKTDGDRIYLLHGGTLFVLLGWPADSTSILGSAPVEGDVTEMFVRDGKAVVFSRVYLDPSVLPGAKVAPNGYYDYYGYGSTKITVLDVTSARPSVLRESYLEGDYVSARRHDGLVRAVVQNGFKVPQIGNPYIEYVDVFGHPYPQEDIDAQVDDWLERTVRAIRNTEIGDWLPREYSKLNGLLTEEDVRCEDYYSPDPGLTESGVTSVVSLDLDDVAAPFSGATILGRAERVYSNQGVVLITQTDYRFQLVRGSTEQTVIHRFDIEGNDTAYVASGAVAGVIHDQFSLDEQEGVVRVSTTEQNWQNWGGVPEGIPLPADGVTIANDGLIAPPVRPSGPVNRVVTLGTQGAELVQLGATQDFGINETIYSTRFIGDLGYVVTFRQVDPLVVVDLSDPTRPTVVGELKVPGYSSFLFPFGEDHLFAIGQDATPEGRVQGLSLSIFDVSNPASPALAQRFNFPESGASPANIDHRAINFHTNGEIVAFPYRRHDTGASTLEVFQLSAAQGFTRLGGMSEPLDLDYCLTQYYGYPEAEAAQLAETDPVWRAEVLAGCGWSREFRRGLFRDDFVYGISNTGVYAYNLADMAAGAVGQVSLPAPQYTYSMGGGMIGIGTATPSVSVEPPQPTEPAPGPGGMPAPAPDGADSSGDPEEEP